MAQELHFGNAAKRLHISQPPLSQAIRQLEEDLGTELFLRTTRSVQLTPAGEMLYAQLQQMQHETAHLRARLKAVSAGKAGVVRIGVTPSGIYSNFSAVLRHFVANEPEIDLNIVELSTEQMIDKLGRDLLDIGLIRLVTPMPGLTNEVVYREPLSVAMRHDHPLAARSRIRAKDLEGVPMIAYDPVRSPYFHHLTTRWLTDHNVAVDYVQTGILPTILALVDGEAGLAIVPSIFSKFQTFGLHYVPLIHGDQYLAQLSVAWRTQGTDTLVRHVAEVLLQNRALFAGETDK